MFRHSIKLLAIATTLMAGTSALAQEKQSSHTLGSGGDVWRIELRNMERFLAMSAGDDDGVSELRHIDVVLEGPDAQFHTVREANPFVSVNHRPGSQRNTVDVGIGDRVSLQRQGTTDNYHLWIHAKERAQGDLGPALINFNIKVAARELDCTRDRVCRRGSTGKINYFVSLPVPAVRSYDCNVQNTYSISAVNGATMVLQPRNARAPTRSVTVRHETSAKHSTKLIAIGQKSGLTLAMQNGEICLASTTR